MSCTKNIHVKYRRLKCHLKNASLLTAHVCVSVVKTLKKSGIPNLSSSILETSQLLVGHHSGISVQALGLVTLLGNDLNKRCLPYCLVW